VWPNSYFHLSTARASMFWKSCAGPGVCLR
jgi:hypothetical protein